MSILSRGIIPLFDVAAAGSGIALGYALTKNPCGALAGGVIGANTRSALEYLAHCLGQIEVASPDFDN